jgi:hypothetical protein
LAAGFFAGACASVSKGASIMSITAIVDMRGSF